MTRPVASRTATDSAFVDHVGERPPGEHGRPRHRQRSEPVDEPLREVLGQPEGRHEPAEGDVLHDDPGDQEVDVVVARRADRPAEHVGEQQHEHDRLDRGADQQVGRAREAHEVALGDDERVGDDPAPHAATSGPGVVAAAASAPRRRTGLGMAAGQRQEHVVERRAAQRDVVDADARLVQAADGLDDRAAARGDGRAHAPVLRDRRLVGHRRERGHGRGGGGAVGQADLHALAAHVVLELVGGAVGDHPALVDDRDAVRQPVGLVEVLRRQQHGGPVGDEVLDRLPQVQPAARVQPRGRLVEEQDRRAGHERGREVQAPAHATRVRLRPDALPPRRGRSAPAGRAPGAWPARGAPRTGARPSRGSPPRSGSRRRRRTARPGRSARAAPPRRARRPGRPRARCPRPAAGASPGRAPSSSCRRRWGRARPGRCRAPPPGRRRPARARRRTTSRGPRRRCLSLGWFASLQSPADCGQLMSAISRIMRPCPTPPPRAAC